ncbi:glycosyltransferase [Dyadobacter sandarakinus]|uniref:Glycosyltransferase family 2 protein n=1 Tax=Dyadobacter sandarakinus TaxID=2747268 RepID=A0ABX7I0V5_9BACT|nr:glycosyltransferase family A protein [Dyadobacter sandarakinus]QRQ99467.1 glycosyltransferase family 2 protein [Dyadobacter sandarakinus]
MNNVLVSVIIPTYNDWKRLALCLDALKEQSFPADRFEIIVINNNPADKKPANFVVPQNCILLDEEEPGSYAARNKGIGRAQGTILAFTDSDCIPSADWIKNAVTLLESNKNISRIAGKIDIFYKSNHPTPAELYEKVYAFKQEDIAKSGLSVTGNMFAYKSVFDAVGNFNNTLLSGGDYEWSKRAEQAGFKIIFGENVAIRHPARHRMSDLVKKTKRVVGGDVVTKKSAFIDLLISMKPPMRIAAKQFEKYGKELSLSQKVSVYSIKYYLALVCSVEKLKISWGQQEKRRE